MIDSLSLNALRCFEVSARLLSFTKAARALHLTQSAVSQQIRTLEMQLGYALFLRGHRSLSLTAEGQALLDSASRAFLDIERTLTRLSARRRQLQVACCPSFALQWLVPRLDAFRKAEPGIEVKIWAEFPVLAGSGESAVDADVEISYPRTPDPADIELMPEYLGLAGSPAYLERHPGIAARASLDGVVLLHDSLAWHGGSEHAEWEYWAGALQPAWLAQGAHAQFNLVSMAIGAAMSGQGVAVGRRSLMMDELAGGTLKLAVPELLRSPASHCVRLNNASDPRAHAFVRWLTQACAAFSEAAGRDLCKLGAVHVEA